MLEYVDETAPLAAWTHDDEVEAGRRVVYMRSRAKESKISRMISMAVGRSKVPQLVSKGLYSVSS